MSEGLAPALLLVIGAGALSWLLVAAIRRYSLSRGVLDTPKDRSSHAIPTPRGGGAGVVAAAITAYLVLGPSGGMDWPFALALLAVLPTAIAGWMDDHKPLPVLPRLAAHFASGVLILPLALQPGLSSTATVLLAASWLFATVSAINVVNFIDGIDGLIGLQTVAFAVHLALLSDRESAAWAFGVSIAGAGTGFLLWNWAPARIFLGDVGSGALAILGLVGGILVWRTGAWPFVAVFLPLFAIFLDAAVAIVRRVRRGESITAAHRTHLYQRLANEGGWGHARVATLYGTVAMAASALILLVPEVWIMGTTALYATAVLGLGAWLDRRVSPTAVA